MTNNMVKIDIHGLGGIIACMCLFYMCSANQPKVEVERPKKDVKPILLNEINAIESKIKSLTPASDKPLSEVIEDKPKLHNKNRDSKHFKVREVYDYRNKETPKFFQNAEYKDKNRHLPKVFYQGGYSKLLFDAVEQKNLGAINVLIERGADINARETKSGATPLMRAVEINSDSVVRYLVIRGADINAYNTDRKTPMHVAAQNDYANLFYFMAKNGGDPYVHDKDGKSALDYLSKDERAEYIIAGLKTQSDRDGALIDFARDGSLEAAKKVIALGANVNTQDSSGNSALMLSVQKRDIQMATLLLFYGANPMIRNNTKDDAYTYAVQSGDQELVNIVDTYIIKQELVTGLAYSRAIKSIVRQEDSVVHDSPVISESEEIMKIDPISERRLEASVVERYHDVPALRPKRIIPVDLN